MSLRTGPTMPTMTNSMEEESQDTVSQFPYSHRRSDSRLAPVKRTSLRRNNSVVRTGKEIIPLVLTAEVAQEPQRRPGHRRGLSVNLNKSTTTTSAPAQRKERPSSMFFDRFFATKDAAGIVEQVKTPTPPTERSSYFTSPSGSTCSCTKSSDASRLAARITDLEAERETKDLTISMLSEQLLDATQELELLRMKVSGLERALAVPDSHEMTLPLHDYTDSNRSGRDSAIGSADSCSPTLSHDSFPMTREDAIRDENAALKAEIVRLNHVLDDGLGALSDLGI